MQQRFDAGTYPLTLGMTWRLFWLVNRHGFWMFLRDFPQPSQVEMRYCALKRGRCLWIDRIPGCGQGLVLVHCQWIPVGEEQLGAVWNFGYPHSLLYK